MLQIKVPDNSYSRQVVALDNNIVTLYFKYNIRDGVEGAWYMDIFDGDDNREIISGIKIVPNQSLTGRYILEDLREGNIWCLRVKNNYSRIDRNNLGDEKAYSLYWISSSEEQEIGLDGVIQLQ